MKRDEGSKTAKRRRIVKASRPGRVLPEAKSAPTVGPEETVVFKPALPDWIVIIASDGATELEAALRRKVTKLGRLLGPETIVPGVLWYTEIDPDARQKCVVKLQPLSLSQTATPPRPQVQFQRLDVPNLGVLLFLCVSNADKRHDRAEVLVETAETLSRIIGLTMVLIEERPTEPRPDDPPGKVRLDAQPLRSSLPVFFQDEAIDIVEEMRWEGGNIDMTKPWRRGGHS